MGFLIKLVINIIALFFVVNIVPGISASSWESLIVAAVIIGLLNSFLRPVLILLTLPINILSVGLFTLVINGFMFFLASKVVKGFVVTDFFSAFLAAILFSIASVILNTIFSPGLVIRTGPTAPKSTTGKKNNDVIDVEGKVVD